VLTVISEERDCRADKARDTQYAQSYRHFLPPDPADNIRVEAVLFFKSPDDKAPVAIAKALPDIMA
jgi:hypothetical protein